MQSTAPNPLEYLETLPAERKEALGKLRNLMIENLPDGFEETMGYGMMGFVVPHSIYPAGYHCDPKQPLPFVSIASQKNFISVYHMGLYAKPELLEWFTSEYPKHVKTKLDMGKSCIRFKKPENIPFDLLAELFRKMTPQDWIEVYESELQKSKK
ncbi:DUF1801 domain-containing protein [Adhaeribacter sp. BT258]|uniref:DUF1801 domain-containing protein n=1 Tax=Adhaeribacter terrigena TaxID=2793070 RepID=A0ABS1C322_9BACT|nr:DUF1801 domain-containing protein [Adhaeribacter terrigena]MBK0403801.1 DUF1801 domain-containing protein [Adhaeribacter terrigena]